MNKTFSSIPPSIFNKDDDESERVIYYEKEPLVRVNDYTKNIS